MRIGRRSTDTLIPACSGKELEACDENPTSASYKMNRKFTYLTLLLLAVATALHAKGDPLDAFSERRMFDGMFDWTLSKEYVDSQGGLSLKIAPHWSFHRTRNILYFDFKYDTKSGKWFHVSDGLYEEFIRPPSRGYYENWFAEAIDKRNEMRAARGEALIDGKLKKRPIEEIEREEADLAQKRKVLLEALEKERNLRRPQPISTANRETQDSSAPTERNNSTKTWLFSLTGSIACVVGLFLWLKIRSRRKKN